MTPKYAYSYDREDYRGQYSSPELAYRAAVSNAESLNNPPTTVYVGTIVAADPQASDHAECIINSMSQRAHVDYGDPAAKYMRSVTPEQVSQLDKAIETTVLTWLQDNKLMPTFVRVAGIREFPISSSSSAGLNEGGEREVQEIGTADYSGL